jgi:hypothetical protein
LLDYGFFTQKFKGWRAKKKKQLPFAQAAFRMIDASA